MTTTIRRNAHRKIDTLASAALRARLLDHGDMGEYREIPNPADAAGLLADWKAWSKTRGRGPTCGASVHERTNAQTGERELVLWLSWHMNRLLEYVLDPAQVEVS